MCKEQRRRCPLEGVRSRLTWGVTLQAQPPLIVPRRDERGLYSQAMTIWDSIKEAGKGWGGGGGLREKSPSTPSDQ